MELEKLRMEKTCKIVFILLFFSWFQPAISQESAEVYTPVAKVKIPEKDIQDYKNNPDFNYEIEIQKENFIVRIWNWIKQKFLDLLKTLFDGIFGVKLSNKYFKYFIRSLRYIALLVFAWLIYRFLLGSNLLKLKTGKNKKLGQVNLSDDERIIQEENLDELIKKAIAKKDYRLAVRYHYLKVLKFLIEKSAIDWQPEKTNRDYVREVRNTPYATGFRKLTFTYDYVWYGNFYPDEREFIEIQDDFKHFYNNFKEG